MEGFLLVWVSNSVSPSAHSHTSSSTSSLLRHSPLTHPLPLTYAPSLSPAHPLDVLALFYMYGCFACICIYVSLMCMSGD